MPMFDYPNAGHEARPLPSRCHYRMPASPRDEEAPRRRRKEYDRERESAAAREKQRSSTKLTSTKSYRRWSRSRERERDSPRSATSDRISRKTSVTVPEMERRPSGSDVKPKSAYPTFSKAHSREAVGSREDITIAKGSPNAPSETSEGGREREKRRNSTPASGLGPLPFPVTSSPPLAAESQDMKRSRSGGSIGSFTAQVKSEMENGRKSADATVNGARAADGSMSNTNTSTNIRKETRFAESEVSSMPGAFPEDERRSTPNSGYRATVSTQSQPTSSVTDDSNPDSDATSIPDYRKDERPTAPRDDAENTPTGSDTQTPTGADSNIAHAYPFPKRMRTPVIEVKRANAYVPSYPARSMTNSSLNPKTPLTAVPPPPPPPPLNTGQNPPPRVDYLLKNGGLPSAVPKRLVQNGLSVQQYSTYQSPALNQMAPIEEYAKIFSSIHKRLDDYLHVLNHHGSLAVATGYKSVARRLLDKLSQVFARDISTQRCDCVICKTTPQPELSDEEDSGVSWGEILEFVSGRRELPQWPPFTIAPDEGGLGIAGSTLAPMQKLDIDVPEEYKDHYIRQNQKTKKAVQSWLSHQPEFPSSPPEDADEDTLMFAMMTKLDAQQRNYLIALMHGQNAINPSRAPTPAERPTTTTPALKRAGKALQRLYRLVRFPRDCEIAMYLLNNPPQHGMLATLAEVNEQEWEILVSGRFDGFLWSGADAPFPPSVSGFSTPISTGPWSPAPSRAPSRHQNPGLYSARTPMTPFSGMTPLTPYSNIRNIFSPGADITPRQQPAPPQSVFPSRGPTPALNGLGVDPPPPVQLDEDTEIAVLAEVERNLFNDMERFEDAFELLHSRAELVRQLLRERSAGLSMRAQQRRGSMEAVVRLDTPASAATDFEQDDDDDDGLADLASLAPDDSASQISVNKRHRKRHERRTPAPVVEEDESLFEEERYQRGGRRSKY